MLDTVPAVDNRRQHHAGTAVGKTEAVKVNCPLSSVREELESDSRAHTLADLAMMSCTWVTRDTRFLVTCEF